MKKNILITSFLLIISSICKTNFDVESYPMTHIEKKSLISHAIPSLKSGTMTENDLLETSKISKNSYNDKTLNTEYSTSTYQSGIIDNYFNYKLISIEEIYGVYSHFNNYVLKSLLESGGYNASYNQTQKYISCSENTVFFKTSVSVTLESKISSSLSINSGNLENENIATLDTNYYYESSCRNSTRIHFERQSQISFNVNNGIINYCPTGYAITIGTVASFYVIKLAYRNCVKTWFGDKKDNYTETTITIVDESHLIDTFVYKKIGNQNNQTYYCRW